MCTLDVRLLAGSDGTIRMDDARTLRTLEVLLPSASVFFSADSDDDPVKLQSFCEQLHTMLKV